MNFLSASPHLLALVEWYRQLSPDTLPEIRHYYREDARFRDPFNRLDRRDAVEALFARMFRTLDNPVFRFTGAVEQGQQAFLLWTFEFRLRGRNWCIEGSTHLEFDAHGQVILHRDYWDAAEELYEKLPVIGFLLRQLKKLA